MSYSLRPHEPRHAKPPCPSPTPGVHPNPRRFRGYLRHTPSPIDLVTHFRVKMKISVAYKPMQWVWRLINSCEVPHNGNRIVALFYGKDFMGGASGQSEYQRPLLNFFNYKKRGGHSFLVLSIATLSKVSPGGKIFSNIQMVYSQQLIILFPPDSTRYTIQLDTLLIGFSSCL